MSAESSSYDIHRVIGRVCGVERSIVVGRPCRVVNSLGQRQYRELLMGATRITDVDLLLVALAGDHEVTAKPGGIERNDFVRVGIGQRKLCGLPELRSIDVGYQCRVFVVEEWSDPSHLRAGI